MKYVDFYGHKVSKLIVGDNPFNGHSYIQDQITGAEMLDYHTEDKVLEAIYRMEELGINTMLPLADPFMIRVLRHYRKNGGKMNFIFQQYAPIPFDVSLRMIAGLEPIGAYVSGSYVDEHFELEDKQAVIDLVAASKETGIKIGIGTHHPEVIEACEKEEWGADFYMACMYNFRRNRKGEKSGFLTGKTKAGIVAAPEDRPVMLKALKNVKRPILAFKLFAGGQMLLNKTEEERRVLIEEAYDTVFTTLKEDDMGVIGVFQKYHDQIGEDIEIFDQWMAKQK